MSLSDFENRLLENVDEFGWQASHIFDDKGKNPDFTYSVGFSKTLNGPEFIVFGLDKDLMHNMLWEVFHQLSAGAKPKDGMRWQNIIEGFDCISKKATHPALFTEYAVSAKWLSRHFGQHDDPEVYQLVWPGAQQGLFPWEENCDEYVINQQPALWTNLH